MLNKAAREDLKAVREGTRKGSGRSMFHAEGTAGVRNSEEVKVARAEGTRGQVAGDELLCPL